MSDSTKLALATPDAAAVGSPMAGSIFDNGGDFGLQLWSSFPPEEAGRVIGLVQGQATPLADMIGKDIAIRHVVAHRIEMVDKDTGEVSIGDRIVLVATDGAAYGSVSDGVRRSLQLLMQVYGKPPWTPPLLLTMQQITTRSGKRTFCLNPVAKK